MSERERERACARESERKCKSERGSARASESKRGIHTIGKVTHSDIMAAHAAVRKVTASGAAAGSVTTCNVKSTNSTGGTPNSATRSSAPDRAPPAGAPDSPPIGPSPAPASNLPPRRPISPPRCSARRAGQLLPPPGPVAAAPPRAPPPRSAPLCRARAARMGGAPATNAAPFPATTQSAGAGVSRSRRSKGTRTPRLTRGGTRAPELARTGSATEPAVNSASDRPSTARLCIRPLVGR